MIKKCFKILLIILALAGPGLAEPTTLALGKEGAPVSVDAEKMELFGMDNIVLFTGNVTAVRGEMSIASERLEVRSDEKGNIKTILATEDVRMRMAQMAAVAGRAEYDLEADLVELTEDPRVWRGRDAVGGERITIHIADSRISVDKARAVLFPEELKVPAGE
ncbi:MAG: hypothetical protein C0608_05515 [Deltaproteobacteria bacterium]|nr:MAG: hypothetical protein C0608_05515 [Deltaproteobacteria bacterium]